MLSQDWYTPQDLAAELGVSYRTILNAIALGELVGYRIGRGEGHGPRRRGVAGAPLPDRAPSARAATLVKRIEAGIWAYETGAGERRYQVRYRDGVRQRGRSFSRLQDARAFRAEVALARQQRRELRAPRLLRTLGQYAEEIWMPEAQWAPATRKRNQSVWERWIRPAPLTDLPIAAIDAEDILDWQQWARDRGVGAATLRLARIILSGAFTHAAARPRSSGVRSNPVSAARIGLPRRRRLRIVAAYP